MRVVGTQYSIEKKPKALQLKRAGQIVATFDYIGKSVVELSDEVWDILRRKGVNVNKEYLIEEFMKMFPGVRRHGPIKG